MTHVLCVHELRRSKRPRSASLRDGVAAHAAAGDATAETAHPNSAGPTHQAAPGRPEAPAAPTTPSVPASVAGGSALHGLRGMVPEFVQGSICRLIPKGRQGRSEAADTVGTGDLWGHGAALGRGVRYRRSYIPPREQTATHRLELWLRVFRPRQFSWRPCCPPG